MTNKYSSVLALVRNVNRALLTPVNLQLNLKTVTFCTKNDCKNAVATTSGKKLKFLGAKSELVTLVSTDGKVMGVKSRSEAEVLAKKNNWVLALENNDLGIKKYPVYKFLNSAQVQMSEKSKDKGKTIKMLKIGQNISMNDLEVKAKSIQKWIQKEYDVKIIVTGSIGKEALLEALYENLGTLLKDRARLLQKSVKNGSMKFTITQMPKERE